MQGDLLPKVARGDRDAVAACLDAYGKLVWSVARRFTSSRADAEDSVQDIFIDLWSHAARFDPSKCSEAGFVVMVARRRMIDKLRKVSRHPVMEDLSTRPMATGDDPNEAAETRSEAAVAERLMGELKPEQQQVIRLAVYEGSSHQEIADLLGMPLGTVKTHLRRGLLQIRAAMPGGVR